MRHNTLRYVRKEEAMLKRQSEISLNIKITRHKG